METMKLQAKPRTKLGKQGSKDSRRRGALPAILYGHGMKPLAVEVNYRDFLSALHTKAGENVLINLDVEGVKLKESTCLIKEMQHHPVSDKVEHVDFTVISLTEKITVKVHLTVSHAEEAAGIKEGGVLDIVHHEIEIECLPTQIPDKIEVNVKDMKINDAIHVKDLVLAQGISVKLSPDEVVVAIHPPAKEEEPAAAEGEATQPEVIEKGKKPAEGEEGAAAPAAEKKAPAAPEKK